jgi:hypothetical protein
MPNLRLAGVLPALECGNFRHDAYFIDYNQPLSASYYNVRTKLRGNTWVRRILSSSLFDEKTGWLQTLIQLRSSIR